MLNFLKRTKTSSEVLVAMFQIHAGADATLRAQSETWNDEEVSVATRIREEECLFLFAVFSAIQACKLPAREKEILLDRFREVLSGDVRAGKVDPQVELNLQDYCDAKNASHPAHLNPLWNVGKAFARHIGADNDMLWVNSGATGYAGSLMNLNRFLNDIGKSYRIVRG